MKGKAVLSVLLFCVLLLPGFGQQQKITHDQFYVVPAQNCVVDDIVGQFYINCIDTIFNTRVGNYSYQINGGNSDNAFRINSNGVIIVSNPAAIKYGSDFNLKIAVSIDDRNETARAKIHILHPDSVYFIDPRYSGIEIGTRDKPFNNWNSDIRSTRIKSGFAYLWKRGTINQEKDNIFISNNSSSKIYIGAYGAGPRPVLDGRNTHDDNGILVGSSWKCPVDRSLVGENIVILDLVIKGYNAENRNSLRIAPNSSNIQLHRIFASGGHYNGCFYFGKHCDLIPQNILIQDCQAKDNPVSHLLKSEAGGVTVRNFWGQNAPEGVGISFPVSPNNIAEYFKLESIGETAINIRKKNTHYSYGYINGGYRGIYLYDDGAGNMAPDDCSLTNLLIENTYSYGMLMEDGNNVLVEQVEIRGCKASAIAVRSDMENLNIERCRIHHNISNGIDIKGNSSSININYNIIYKNGIGVNVSEFGNSLNLHNNILINNNSSDVLNGTSIEAGFYNNVYEKISSGWNPKENNHKYSNQPCFRDPSKGDFYPIEGTFIIDNAKDFGFTKDFFGNAVPQFNKPDIGAIEFLDSKNSVDDQTNDDNTDETDETDDDHVNNSNTVDPPNENHSPSIKNQSFNNTSSKSEIRIGRVVASDPDNDQLSFEIVSGNNNNYFSINSNSGDLKFYSPHIDIYTPYSFTLDIKVTDNGNPSKSAESTIDINIKPGSNIVYIDPKNNGIEDGTIDHPYNSWSDVVWSENHTYVQKRNTSTDESKILITAGNVALDAYGIGDLPVVNYSGEEYAFKAYEKSNISVNNLHIVADDAIGCLYFLGSETVGIEVYGCEFNGAINGVRAIDIQEMDISYNTFFQTEKAIYSYAVNMKIYYNLFKSNTVAIDVSGVDENVLVYNNVFYDNSEGLSVGYASSSIYNNIFYLLNTGDVALIHKEDQLVSDNNIFYPEQSGFIQIGNTIYNNFDDYQHNTDLDKNSLINDPKFIDVLNGNFKLDKESPAINRGIFVGQEKDFDGHQVPYGGKPDIGILENFDVLLATAIGNIVENEVVIYPNPTSDYINLQFSNIQSHPYLLSIRDLNGKTIISQNLSLKNEEISERLDMSELPKGTYLLSLRGGDQLYSEKIILE